MTTKILKRKQYHSPTGFSISATIPDRQAALPEAILLMDFVNIFKVMAGLDLKHGFSLSCFLGSKGHQC